MHSSHSLKDNLGRRLKQARQRAGLSQSEMASLLKTNQSTISRLERGSAPRPQLSELVEAYLDQYEAPTLDRIEEIVTALARSDELRALVRRIVVEA